MRTSVPSEQPVETAAEVMHERTAAALQRNLGRLNTAANARMEHEVEWFGRLSAKNRAWVGAIVSAGIRSFVDWWENGGRDEPADNLLAAEVFGAAPRALTGVITLQQTVDLLRLGFDVMEVHLNRMLPAEDAPAVHAGLLRYSRELAFATARVYARAAEVRGAWDARLEALVVDSVVRGDADAEVLSRASALGWGRPSGVCVVVGDMPAERSAPDVVAQVRRQALTLVTDVLAAIQGHRLVVVLGGTTNSLDPAAALAEQFGSGPVVVGPIVGDLTSAFLSAREAVAGYDVAAAWPDAPRPTHAFDLLPERLLGGDRSAAEHLVRRVYEPLADHRSTLITTLSTYFAAGSSIEATARSLFVHPNTVRYRLSKVDDLTGCSPSESHDAFTLRIALTLGRLHDADPAEDRTGE